MSVEYRNHNTFIPITINGVTVPRVNPQKGDAWHRAKIRTLGDSSSDSTPLQSTHLSFKELAWTAECCDLVLFMTGNFVAATIRWGEDIFQNCWKQVSLIATLSKRMPPSLQH